MKLLLFDIDGTLLDTEGASFRALKCAFYELFPRETARRTMPALDLAGATDSGITGSLFGAFGIESSAANHAAVIEAYGRHLRRALGLHEDEPGPPPGRLMPGIVDLLVCLTSHAHFTLSLLTGNVRHGAGFKTAAYGIASFFNFDCGAYGDDHWDRNALGPIALDRTAKHTGRSLSPADVVVIGDTPKDIACGKALGARTLAVATGRFDEGALVVHEPDYLLADLTDLNAVLQIVA